MATVAPQLRSLQQPMGMYKPSWLRLKKVLRALSRYGDTPYPGLRRLSQDTKIPFRTVGRLLTQAEELGLISRTKTAGRRSYTYIVLPNVVPVSDQSGTEVGLRPTSQTSSENQTSRRMAGCARKGARPLQDPETGRRLNRWAGVCAVCRFPVLPKEGYLHGRLPVHQFCDDGVPDPARIEEQEVRLNMAWNSYERRQQQEDLNPSGVIGASASPESAGVVTPVSDPAVRLAHKFERAWIEIMTEPEFEEWKRPFGNMGAAIGYIRSKMLGATFTEEHCEAYFANFFDDLCFPTSPTKLGPNQSPWQRFTGWWINADVPDPAIDRRLQAEIAEIRKEARSKTAIRDEAMARIDAILDEGGTWDEMSPDDLDLAGLNGANAQAAALSRLHQKIA